MDSGIQLFKYDSMKCALGVFSGEFLEFTVHRRGIDLGSVRSQGYLRHEVSQYSQIVVELFRESFIHSFVHSSLGLTPQTNSKIS